MSAQSNTQGYVYAEVSLRHGTRTSRRSISSRPKPSSAILPTNGYRSGEPLSKATLYATLTALTRFFVWLAGQPGYKSRISYLDAEYFNLSAKETRIAKVKHWSSASPIRQIFKEAFAVAGLRTSIA